MCKIKSSAQLVIRVPQDGDGLAVHRLIAACPPLDTNSIYCNLLQVTHFADTCVVAEMANKIVGFLSAYRHPQQSHTLFVWQIAVAHSMRGQGIAVKMITALLERDCNQDIQQLQATINPNNTSSWGLFRKLAKRFDADLHQRLLFDAADFANQHQDEIEVSLGPIQLHTQLGVRD